MPRLLHFDGVALSRLWFVYSSDGDDGLGGGEGAAWNSCSCDYYYYYCYYD